LPEKLMIKSNFCIEKEPSVGVPEISETEPFRNIDRLEIDSARLVGIRRRRGALE